MLAGVHLAQINARLERISVAQHLLARKRALLQAAATRLRLGADPELVEAEVRAGMRAAANR